MKEFVFSRDLVRKKRENAKEMLRKKREMLRNRCHPFLLRHRFGIVPKSEIVLRKRRPSSRSNFELWLQSLADFELWLQSRPDFEL